MSPKPRTVDFGAPAEFGSHVFLVEIAASRQQQVVICEDYGYRGLEDGAPRDEQRVVLERPVWSGISNIARLEFNARLKAAGVLTGRWHTGTNRVERLLGKELCVLAWAAGSAGLTGSHRQPSSGFSPQASLIRLGSASSSAARKNPSRAGLGATRAFSSNGSATSVEAKITSGPGSPASRATATACSR